MAEKKMAGGRHSVIITRATWPGSRLLCGLIPREIAISGGTAHDSLPKHPGMPQWQKKDKKRDEQP